MRRWRLRFVVFALALGIPVALLVARALESVEFERRVRHDAVAERIFDEMERSLSALLEREEERPFGHYGFYYTPAGTVGGETPVTRSPLAELPAEPFIVGSFQIDPDGSVNTPLRPRDAEAARQAGDWQPRPDTLEAIAEIDRVVGTWWQVEANHGSTTGPFAGAPQSPGTTQNLGVAPALAHEESEDVSVYGALRSLNKGASRRANRQLKVIEESVPLRDARGAGIPSPSEMYAEEAAAEPRASTEKTREAKRRVAKREDFAALLESRVQSHPRGPEHFAPRASAGLPEPEEGENAPAPSGSAGLETDVKVRVELSPMLGRVIDPGHMLVYRTALVGTSGYRQGLLFDMPELERWLWQQAVGTSGLDRQADLDFSDPYTPSPVAVPSADYVYRHRFAEPFDDLGVTLALAPLPGLGGGGYVYGLAGLLAAAGVLALFALYRMVAVAVSFAERRSNFAAAVSHELKTPLTAIRMYGEMLRDDLVESDAKRREYYGSITLESERLGRLIDNVLEFSRLEQGTRSLSPVVGDLGPALEETVELMRPHVEREGFTLELELEPDRPTVRFDRDALVQVLFNLVDNAVKYARDAEHKRIILRCAVDGGGLRLSVRDFGPGVSPRQLARVFEPFYRVENEMTRKSQGTGIGLALVQSLVSELGGKISAHNVEPTGLEIALRLPAAA